MIPPLRSYSCGCLILKFWSSMSRGSRGGMPIEGIPVLMWDRRSSRNFRIRWDIMSWYAVQVEWWAGIFYFTELHGNYFGKLLFLLVVLASVVAVVFCDPTRARVTTTSIRSEHIFFCTNGVSSDRWTATAIFYTDSPGRCYCTNIYIILARLPCQYM